MAGFPPYDNAADLNSRFKALGPYLMRMRTCSELLFASSNCTMGMSCAVPSAFRSKRTRSTEFQLLSGHFTHSVTVFLFSNACLMAFLLWHAGNCASRCQVYLRANDTDPSRKLRASGASVMLSNISKGDYNIGLFQPEGATAMEPWGESSENDDANHAQSVLARAPQALMLQNHDAANFRFTTVEWGSTGPPLEVDQYSGQAHVAEDAAPHVGGFQVMLGAGEARLYVFTK
jgi:hypothetical protein